MKRGSRLCGAMLRLQDRAAKPYRQRTDAVPTSGNKDNGHAILSRPTDRVYGRCMLRWITLNWIFCRLLRLECTKNPEPLKGEGDV